MEAGATTVYIDSGVMVALSIAGDAHHDDAVGACTAMEQGKCHMITSSLAVMEAVAAVRKRITMSHKRRSGSEDERADVDAHASRAAAGMLNLVSGMARQGFLRIVELDDRSPDLYLLHGKALARAGRAVYGGKSRFYRYRGVGSCDWLHFAFARDAGASVICTTDAAFADIEGSDDEFGHIRIQLTGAPLIDLLIDGGAGRPADRPAGTA